MVASRSRSTERRPSFRASWKGPIRFGLVSFEVQAINAEAKEHSEIHFHMLHAPDHQRIRYVKVCPKHGEVPNDEIVRGFEHHKGQYIEVEKDELDAFRTEKERSLTIEAFVAPDEIDPLYFDGRMYYLIPGNKEAEEAYSLLAEAMNRQDRWGVGQVVFSGREQLALIRPVDGVLTMAMLNYDAEIRKPSDIKTEFNHPKTNARHMKLAEDLIRHWEQEDFDFSTYKDRYREKVSKLLEAKKKGAKVVVPAEEEEPRVINLMEALKRSVRKGNGSAEKARNGAPRSTRSSATKSGRTSTERKRKKA